MRESVVAIATGLVIVAACASVAPYGGGTTQASNTLYCWKDRLVDEPDKLVCNWAPTRYDACHGRMVTYLEKRLVTAQPSPATRCDNGESLVVVKTG